MFGYIRAAKPELRMKEYELYKAVYCSLCRELGKSYGIFSRFTLSYDFTFLALLEMALKENCSGIKKGRCVFNPLKQCNYCKDSDSFKMPSAAAMIMLYYKLRDNIKDEKGIKKLGYAFILPIFSRAHKKAAEKYPDIEKTVFGYIEAQNAVEAENCAQIDRAADPTAKALAEILTHCSDDLSQKRILERIGYCLGRYIYILDAACDYSDDIKKNSYNVLRNTVSGQQLGNKEKSEISKQLFMCLNEAGKAFELLDIKRYKSILGNIIYLGLEETFKKELQI